MATDRRSECMILNDEEVAGEQMCIVAAEFPNEYSKMAYIIISGTKYINKGFTSGSPEKP